MAAGLDSRKMYSIDDTDEAANSSDCIIKSQYWYRTYYAQSTRWTPQQLTARKNEARDLSKLYRMCMVGITSTQMKAIHEKATSNNNHGVVHGMVTGLGKST